MEHEHDHLALRHFTTAKAALPGCRHRRPICRHLYVARWLTVASLLGARRGIPRQDAREAVPGLRATRLPVSVPGGMLAIMPPITNARRRATAEAVPCLQVKINGKKIALVGLHGEGGVAATVSRWWQRPGGGQKRRATQRDPTFNVRLDVTDANDPACHRMYAWPTVRVREGDRVEVRVIHGAPERGRFHGKYNRTRGEEVPFEDNDTYTVIGNMATWVDGTRVCLKESSMSRQPMRFTAAAARRVAKALMDAARHVERRTRK
jgi:hypothetical protein